VLLAQARLELYDLAAAPSEQCDLAAERPELAAQLDAALSERLGAMGAKLPAANERR